MCQCYCVLLRAAPFTRPFAVPPLEACATAHSTSAFVEVSSIVQHTPIRMLAVAPSSTDRARSGHVTQYPRAPNVKRFEKLDGDDFRHPLDQQNTALLRSLPGLEMVARTVLGGPGFEEALYLENIGAALQVGPDQLPTLHRLHLQASSCLNMDPPALYVRQVRLLCSAPAHGALHLSVMRAFACGAVHAPTATFAVVRFTVQRPRHGERARSTLLTCCTASRQHSAVVGWSAVLSRIAADQRRRTFKE